MPCASITSTGVRGKLSADGASIQAVPNPMNSTTDIQFAVTETGKTQIELYGMDGKKVITIFNGIAESGIANEMSFDAGPISAGIYLLRLTTANGETQQAKLVIVK